jgi:hypothetical protein
MSNPLKFKLNQLSLGLDIGGTLTKIAIACPKLFQDKLRNISKNNYEGIFTFI